jgi:hypothetical protein
MLFVHSFVFAACVSLPSADRSLQPNQHMLLKNTVSDDSNFLSNWMGNTMSVLGNLALLDLSLPGTHDTMTYDLSDIVSDGGIDDHDELAKILHEFSGTTLFAKKN